jgi:hypothetical protein
MADDRNKAIEAMQRLNLPWVRIDDARAGRLLDAIPADVLVDLAIERGALVPVLVAAHDWDLYDADATTEEERLPSNTPLYRRTDGGGDG